MSMRFVTHTSASSCVICVHPPLAHLVTKSEARSPPANGLLLPVHKDQPPGPRGPHRPEPGVLGHRDNQPRPAPRHRARRLDGRHEQAGHPGHAARRFRVRQNLERPVQVRGGQRLLQPEEGAESGRLPEVRLDGAPAPQRQEHDSAPRQVRDPGPAAGH